MGLVVVIGEMNGIVQMLCERDDERIGVNKTLDETGRMRSAADSLRAAVVLQMLPSHA